MIVAFALLGVASADDIFHNGNCGVPRVNPTPGGQYIPRVYTYQCMRCGLIQQYTFPGVHRCPNDGTYMIMR